MRLSILGVVLALSSATAVTPAAADAILLNGGFESGDLTSWTSLLGSGVVVPTSGEMNPATPHSGSFLFSASNVDGADREGETEITLLQTIDVSGFSFIAAGLGRIEAQGFFSGATGGGGPVTSDDLAQIIVEFFQGGSGGTLLGTVLTTPLDPVVGVWNEVSIPLSTVPVLTDTITFRVRTELQAGFSSIDIGGDDFSLLLTSVATPTPEPSALLLFCAGVIVLGVGRGIARRRKVA